MNRSISLLAVAVLLACLAATAPRPQESMGGGGGDRTAAGAPAGHGPSLDDLAFLAGTWTGTDGQSTWESWYSTPEGGQIVAASKELRDGRTVMIDFEHFYVRDGALRMTPFPFGRRSVEFTLTELDAAARRAVFENPEHDFPRRFTYARTGEADLRIELEGDMGEGDVRLVLELKRAAGR